MKTDKVLKMVLAIALVLVLAFVFAGCSGGDDEDEDTDKNGSGQTGGGTGGNNSNAGSSKAKSIALTENQWANGSIDNPNGEVWYSFNAASGTAYNIWWNDSEGDGTKTLRIEVSAYDSNGTELWNQASGWNTAKTVNLISGGTVYLKVTAYWLNSNSTGTFAIGYSTGSAKPASGWAPPANTPLAANQWTNGSITSGGQVWYSFTAAANTTYSIWWNDSGAGDGSKTANVSVRAYDSKGTVLFDKYESFSIPTTISLPSGGTVYLRVYNGTGTFGILYGTGIVRPDIVCTQLTENQWVNGSINNPNGEVWYSFYAASGTAYNVWWNDSSQGDGTKTLRIEVSAYDSNGTELWNQASGWSTAKTVNIISGGTVYLKVTAYWLNSSSTGTFAIAYNSGGARP